MKHDYPNMSQVTSTHIQSHQLLETQSRYTDEVNKVHQLRGQLGRALKTVGKLTASRPSHVEGKIVKLPKKPVKSQFVPKVAISNQIISMTLGGPETFQQFEMLLKTKIYDRLLNNIRREKCWGTEARLPNFVDDLVKQSFEAAVKSAYAVESKNVGRQLAEATRQKRRNSNAKLV